MTTIYYLDNSGGGATGSGTFKGIWAVNTVYASGDRVICTQAYATTAARAFVRECTTGGTSHASTQPTWDNTVGNTNSDNTVVWTTRACTTRANANFLLYYLTNHAIAAGDTIHVKSTHNEAVGTGNIIFPGTLASPNYLYCSTFDAEPPTTSSTGAIIDYGSNDLQIRGVHFVNGVTFKTSGNLLPAYSGSRTVYRNTTFQNTGANNTGFFNTNNMGSECVCEAPSFKFGNTADSISLGTASGTLETIGGSIISGGSAITQLFATSASASGSKRIKMRGFDMSNAAASVSMMAGRTGGDGAIVLDMFDIKLPASWTGGLFSGTVGPGQRAQLTRGDSGGTIYKFIDQDAYGTAKEETGFVKTGGATDGTTQSSIKVVTTSSAIYPVTKFVTRIMALPFNAATGSPLTWKFDFLVDSAAGLKNNDVGCRLFSLDASGSPIATLHDSEQSEVLGAGTTYGASGQTWANPGTAMTNPNAQEMSITFTPALKGSYGIQFWVAAGSKTVYFDLVHR